MNLYLNLPIEIKREVKVKWKTILLMMVLLSSEKAFGEKITRMIKMITLRGYRKRRKK